MRGSSVKSFSSLLGAAEGVLLTLLVKNPPTYCCHGIRRLLFRPSGYVPNLTSGPNLTAALTAGRRATRRLSSGFDVGARTCSSFIVLLGVIVEIEEIAKSGNH
jgi:hypothetical protein